MPPRDRSEQTVAPGWRRPFKRFWRRQGWRGVAIVAAVFVVVAGAGIWSLVHPAGRRLAAVSGRFTFEVPPGWHYDNPCHEHPLSGETEDTSCTRPDGSGDAVVYLLSVPVDSSIPVLESRTRIVADLSKRVSPYATCDTVPDAHPEDVCLRQDPDRKGELRVRIYSTYAVVALCERTDQAKVQQGCDGIWRSVTPMG